MGVSDNRITPNKKFRNTNVRFEVTNFGPIESGAVDMRPLTVFVGPSNTGKTYLAVLIYALNRILEGFPRIPLMRGLHYPHRLFFESEEPPNLNTTIRNEELRVLLEKWDSGVENLRLSDFPESVRDAIKTSLERPEFLQGEAEEEIRRCFDIDSVSNLIRLPGRQNETHISLSVSEEDQDLWHFHMDVSGSGVVADSQVEDMVIFPKSWKRPKFLDRIFYHLKALTDREIVPTRDRRDRGYLLEALFEEMLTRITDVVASERVGTYYLPAARSGIMQSHRVIAGSLVTRSTRAGLERFPELPTFSGMMADFMQRLILYEDNRPSKRTMNALADQLENEALAGKIRTKRPLSGGYPEFVYRPLNTDQDIRLTRASSMVSELAPVVLFLRGAIQRGDTLIIEEPEAHLHPAAQTRMAVTLARMVRAGVRVVVTTHSDWLLKEIGNLMREGELGEQADSPSGGEKLPSALRPEEVGIWLFRKDGSDSGSTVEEIPFDRIEGVEPRDYEDVAEALYNRSADLQNRLEETKGKEAAESGHE